MFIYLGQESITGVHNSQRMQVSVAGLQILACLFEWDFFGTQDQE